MSNDLDSIAAASALNTTQQFTIISNINAAHAVNELEEKQLMKKQE